MGTLHIHDNDGRSDQHLTPGLGNIDWNGFAKALKDICFNGVLNLEVKTLPTEEDQLKSANIITKLANDIN